MQDGGFLYFGSSTGAETLNALLGAIADREVAVPRLGLVRAKRRSGLVGSMTL